MGILGGGKGPCKALVTLFFLFAGFHGDKLGTQPFPQLE